MRSQGAGGRGDVHRNDDQVLAGVLSDDIRTAAVRRQPCANPRCKRRFAARQDGDLYCCQACDFNDNPGCRGKTKRG